MSGSSHFCCVPGCGKSRAEDTILHAFPNPVKYPKIFLSWVNTLGELLLSLEHEYIFKNRRICHDHFETKYLTWTRRLSANAVPTLHIPGHEPEESLVEKNNQTKKYSHPVQGRQAGQRSLTEQNIPINEDSQIKQDTQTELYNEPLQDSPDEQYEIDTEAPVEIQCDQIFSWQKSNQAESRLNSPVELLELESSNADFKVQASVCGDNQCVPQRGDLLQCCECPHVIPEHSVRYVCVSCTDGNICSVCAADDKHTYHYALRVPAIATQSDVREVLQKIRRVLLEESVIKEEIKEEDDDPLSSATHIVGDASCEDSISQVPNVDIQGYYRLPKSTRKISREGKIFKSSDEDPSEVFEGNSPRKRCRSGTQYQTDVPTEISKEPSVVLNTHEYMHKWAPSPKECEQNKDNKTFTRLKQKSQNVHKVNIRLMKRLLGKRIILQRLGQSQKEKPLSILGVPQKMKSVTILGAVQKKQLDTNLDIIQTKELNIKKIENLQPKRIKIKRPALTAPTRQEESSTSNETINIFQQRKL